MRSIYELMQLQKFNEYVQWHIVRIDKISFTGYDGILNVELVNVSPHAEEFKILLSRKLRECGWVVRIKTRWD